MQKAVSRVLGAVTSVLIAAVVILAILLVGVRVFGLQVYTVLSGSMEDTYKTGSVIYVTATQPDQLAVQDAITFRLAGTDTVATHRIVEIVENTDTAAGYSFRTKGDNNEEADEGLVDPADVIGKPVFTIPYLGYLAAYIQQPPGLYIAIAVAAALLLLLVISELLDGDKKKAEKPTEPSVPEDI